MAQRPPLEVISPTAEDAAGAAEETEFEGITVATTLETLETMESAGAVVEPAVEVGTAGAAVVVGTTATAVLVASEVGAAVKSGQVTT